MLRRIAPVYEPISVARELMNSGFSLKKAHDLLNRLVADEELAIVLPAVEDARKMMATFRRLGIEATVRAAPDASDPKAIRERLGLSQAEFAARFGIDLDTLQNWEQGRNRPDRTARILLRVIELHPEAVEDALVA